MSTKPAPHAGMGVAQYAWSHLAAAPLCRPRQPVADHRVRAPRPHGGAGGAVQARRTLRCSRSSRRSMRPTPPTTTSSRASSATGPCVYLAADGRSRNFDGHRDEGRPGACRHACRWCSARSAPRPCRAAPTCGSRITGIDLLTLDVHASVVERLDDAGALPADALAEEAADDDRVERTGRSADSGDRRRRRRRRRRGRRRRRIDSRRLTPCSRKLSPVSTALAGVARSCTPRC